MPFTRPVANRRARDLFDICAGFVYSQILAACVRLDVFEIVRQHPQSVAELAARLDLPMPSAICLVDGAVALRLLERRSGERIGLGPLGAAMIGNPGIAAMVEHHAMLYGDLQDPVALLKRGGGETELGNYWAYARTETPSPLAEDQVAPYSALMGSSQAMIADDVVAAYPLRRHDCLLDVGGGDGTFVATVAARCAHLRLMLFDLPQVAALADASLASKGLGSRVTVTGGDFLTDPLPTGADVISFVRILHDHNDDSVLTLLRAAFDALPDGGAVVVAEPMSGTTGAEPIGDAYFGFYLFAMGQGRARTPEALSEMLTAVGFTDVSRHPTRRPLLTRVISARKPKSTPKL